MRVILKETIDSLGIIGSEVDVKKGYARNFLIPQGKAVFATEQSRRQMEQERAKIELQMAKERETATQMAEKIEGVVCRIPAKVAEGDRLYGSVTTKDIAEAMKKQDIDIPKRMILLVEPIKETGTYQVPIRIYKDVEPEITVEVVSDKMEAETQQ
ncbi:MAG: 50S ribosomal protein L9 [Desulfosalsimonadaceae bacterium]